MKKSQIIPINRIGFLVVGALALLCLSIAFKKIIRTGSSHEVVSSTIGLSADNDTWSMRADIPPVSGDFNFEGGELTRFQDFGFNVSAVQLVADDKVIEQSVQELLKQINGQDISFKQGRVMILPVMKKVHVIGVLSLGANKQVFPVQFDYKINPDRSINFSAHPDLFLSAFGIVIPDEKAALIPDKLELTIDFTLSPMRSFLNRINAPSE